MSVLVLRALGIGDLATAVPALRGVRAAFPGQRIDLAAPAWLAPLAETIGAVDRVVVTPGLAQPIRTVAPPLVGVNLHGRGPQSHRLLGRLGPRRMLAFACPEAGFTDGPTWQPDEHEVHRWCRMLRWYGVAADPGDLALAPPTVAPPVEGATVVHPGAKEARRRWPYERFAAVAAALEADGHHVVITGSPAEQGLAHAVAAAAGLGADRVLAGRTGVLELAGLIASARLLVSGDTGAAHLATGYATPSVILFGPVSPAQWGPPPDRPRHRPLWAGPSTRSGPESAPHPSLAALTVADVLAAVGEALEAETREASGSETAPR